MKATFRQSSVAAELAAKNILFNLKHYRKFSSNYASCSNAASFGQNKRYVFFFFFFFTISHCPQSQHMSPIPIPVAVAVAANANELHLPAGVLPTD